MNISSGNSCATPFWQTDDIRLGVVGAGHIPGKRSLSVLLSCGTPVSAECPNHVGATAGAAVQVERRDGRWHVLRCLEGADLKHARSESPR